MVLILSGYPMAWNDAKSWALRHWPDMDIYDNKRLAHIIERYHKLQGRRIACVPVAVNKESTLLFVVYSKNDPPSTPHKHRRFPETELALKYKTQLFNHEGDKELAEKSQFTTIADPFKEWNR